MHSAVQFSQTAIILQAFLFKIDHAPHMVSNDGAKNALGA